jgi:hypothetical protein
MDKVEDGLSERLQRLCGRQKGWRTRAAKLLSIPASSLSRYLSLEGAGQLQDIPGKVWQALASAEHRRPTAIPDRTAEMIRCFARGLVAIQDDLDRQGFIRSPYPESLSRAFNVAAGCQIQGLHGSEAFPVDLEELVHCAQRPLYEWVPTLSGAQFDEYLGARLLNDSQVTRECLDLANLEDGDAEHQFFEFLMQRCQALPEEAGQRLYVAWRKAVIENPLADSYAVFLQEPTLSAHIAIALELVDFFYEPVSAALVEDGRLALCPVTGTRLRRVDGRWISESRDPDVQQRLAVSGPRFIPYSPQVIELKRSVRTFWCHPGRYELELAARASELGWSTELWPRFDCIDLLVWRKTGRQRFAVDVKDHLSPSRLARLFEGFKAFRRHQRLVVVPDYLIDAHPRYVEIFDRTRHAIGKDAPRLERMSDFLDRLGQTK